jgi:hypothetical protein
VKWGSSLFLNLLSRLRAHNPQVNLATLFSKLWPPKAKREQRERAEEESRESTERAEREEDAWAQVNMHKSNIEGDTT